MVPRDSGAILGFRGSRVIKLDAMYAYENASNIVAVINAIVSFLIIIIVPILPIYLATPGNSPEEFLLSVPGSG